MENTLSDWNKKALEIINNMSGQFQTTAYKNILTAQKTFKNIFHAPEQEKNQYIHKELFRTIHDLKGQGSTFGYPLITEIGNHLCRYIEKQNTFNQNVLLIIQKHLDVLELILRNHLKDDGGQQGKELKKSIFTEK